MSTHPSDLNCYLVESMLLTIRSGFWDPSGLSALGGGQHSNEQVMQTLAAYSVPRNTLVINLPHLPVSVAVAHSCHLKMFHSSVVKINL